MTSEIFFLTIFILLFVGFYIEQIWFLRLLIKFNENDTLSFIGGLLLFPIIGMIGLLTLGHYIKDKRFNKLRFFSYVFNLSVVFVLFGGLVIFS